MGTRDIGASIATALEDLLKERAIVDHAIQNLQGLLATMKGEGAPAKRRGRPPGSGRKAATSARPATARSTAKSAAKGKSALSDAKAGWSEAARTRARERMRKYWEAKRQGAGLTSKAAGSATAAPRKKRGRPPKNREAIAASES